MLYEADAKDCSPSTVLDDFPIEPDPFAADCVSGVAKHNDEIDQYSATSPRTGPSNGCPSSIATSCRRGRTELVHRRDVPTAVVISEAVELARRYSTEESGPFRQRHARPHRRRGPPRIGPISGASVDFALPGH